MPGSNRRDDDPLRRLGAATVFFLLAAFFLIAVEQLSGIGARRQAAQTETYSNCQNADECGRKSLKVNIRAANANEDSVDVAMWQLVLGTIGMVGVGFTVHFARLAWREAERSADAAHTTLEASRIGAEAQAARFQAQITLAGAAALAATKQAALMDETARRQLQAYLYVEAVTVTWTSEGYPMFRAALRNTGQTPALNVQSGGEAFLSRALGTIPEEGGSYLLSPDSFIGANTTHEVGLIVQGAESIHRWPQPGDAWLRIMGRVEYDSVFGDVFETKFFFFTTDNAPKAAMMAGPGHRAAFRKVGRRDEVG